MFNHYFPQTSSVKLEPNVPPRFKIPIETNINLIEKSCSITITPLSTEPVFFTQLRMPIGKPPKSPIAKPIKIPIEKFTKYQSDKYEHAIMYNVAEIVDFYIILAHDVNQDIGFKINVGPRELQNHWFKVTYDGCVVVKKDSVIVGKYAPIILVRNVQNYQKRYIITFIRNLLTRLKEQKCDNSNKKILFKQI